MDVPGVQTRDPLEWMLRPPRGGYSRAAMDEADRLRLDYEQTTQLLRTLTDIRFKLLAFVPTISGAAVAFFGRPRRASELLAVGLLGLFATIGILLYELRNAQLFDSVVHRASVLEERLGLAAVREAEPARGGLFAERPRRMLTLFGMIEVRHDRGLGFVYGAALAGWTYLVVWGLMRAVDVAGAREIGAVAAVAVGIAVVVEIERLGPQPDAAAGSA
jgi:hypothetical protein